MVKRSLLKKLRRFKAQLQKSGIPVAKLVLFGSQARGTAHKDSDIDVCVVSPILGKDRLKERALLAHQATQVDPLIEAVPVSSKDFKSNRVSPLLHQIRKEAIEI